MNFRKPSFKKRVFYSVAAPLFIATIAGFTFFLYDKITSSERSLERSAESKALYIASLAEYALLSGDKTELNALLASLMASTAELYSVHVYDAGENVFFGERKAGATDVESLRRVVRPVETIRYPFATYDINEEINFPDPNTSILQAGLGKQTVGHVALAISMAQHIEYRNRLILWWVVAMAVALVLGNALAKKLSRALIGPLSDIFGAVSSLREGNYAVRIGHLTGGELGQLSDNINKLAGDLQNAQERIKTQFDELAKARKHALQASQAKSEFMASMSHELRQPLTAIIGFLPSLQRINRDDYAEELLNIMETQAQKLYRRIEEILEFEKIEAGQLNIVNSYFEIESEVNSVIACHRREAQMKSLKLSCVVDRDHELAEAEVFTDRIHIHTIIDNLVGNALKFTKHGCVCLYIVLHRLGDDLLQLELEVRDTGIGIPKDKLDRIFEPFDQADRSSTRPYEGVGLGLHIVKKIIGCLGGKIEVESTIYKGSTFRVYLPLAYRLSEASARADSATRDQHIPTITNKVLYVEDNPSSRTVVQYLLRQIDVETDVADSANEGLALYRKNNYKIVFLDLHIPGMDGFELARKIRKDEEKFNKPSKPAVLIALTADATEQAVEKCYAAGFDNIIYKPFQEVDLFNAVRGILDVQAKLSAWGGKGR